MLTDFRKPLYRISLVAGFTELLQLGGEVVKDKQGQPVLRSTIGFKTCRHAYCCARLATLDRGAPVSQDTVARELGHSSTDLVQEVYGHLGTVRHRSEEVEYRVEQNREILGGAAGGDVPAREGAIWHSFWHKRSKRRLTRAGLNDYL